MSEITPPPVLLPAVQLLKTQAVVSIPQPLPELLKFPIGSEIKAHVVSTTAKGVVSIQIGEVLQEVKTNLSFPLNGDITFKIVHSDAGNIQLRILTINGKAYNPSLGIQQGTAMKSGVQTPDAMPKNAAVQTSDVSSAASKTTHTASNVSNVSHKVTFSQGAGAKATVIQGAKPTAANIAVTANLPSKGQQLPTGTNFTVRITGIQNPTGESKIFQASGNILQKSSVPQNQPAQQQQTAGQKTIVKGNIQQPYQSKSQPFQQMQQMTQQSTQKSVAQPAVQVQAQVLTGTVTGNKISGQPIIQTPVGTISIATHVNLPTGTVVTLGVTDITPPPPPLTENAPVRILGQGAGWAALDESLKVLQKADPVMAERINSLIPQAGAKMAVNMIAFTGALQTGDISSWLGNAPMKALEKAGANGAALAKKLGKEFKELSGRTKEGGGDWRSFTIPMHDGAGIQGITMIVRRQPDKHDDEEQMQRNRIKGGTRFLINLDLSNIGQMQLDGLSYEKDRRLDLIIRTENNLPPEMQNDIRGMFAGSLEVLNYSGNVSFVITENFVELSKDEIEVHQGYGLLV